MDFDDVIYGVAMLLFATIPLESLVKPPVPHGFVSPRVVPTAAFVLLMGLQVRKRSHDRRSF